MQERDHTVDFLKGIAIFLMVMGHFLAGSIGHLDSMPGHNGWLVGRWIYSFHMPLFFLLSGYLIGMKRDDSKPPSWHSLGLLILRKAQTLLLPGLSFMLIGGLVNGKWEMAWFLKVLFQITVVFAFVRFLANRLQFGLLRELFVHVAIFLVWFVVSHYVKDISFFRHIWWHGAAVRYPYLILGYLFAARGWVASLQRCWWITVGAFVLYVCTYYIGFYVLSGSLAFYLQDYVVAPSASLALFGFALGVPSLIASHFGKAICYMGSKTLAIYLLSDFFLLTFPKWADWWIQQNVFVSIFVQFVSALGVSIIVVATCLLVEKILSYSQLLTFVLFGRSMKIQSKFFQH